MTRRPILILILVGYFVLGVLFALKTPAWQAPDEPAHYNYVAYLAENGAFPVLHFGDYPHGYLEQIKAAKFPPDLPITPIRYESHQPPLYYVLAAPVCSLTGGNLTALRLLSVLLGGGIVLLAYAIGRRSAPTDPAVALGAAAFVAFLPQHLATVSQVGNDVLAELLLAAVLFVLAGVMGQAAKRTSPWVLGVLLGLILITKTTAYIAAPLALGVLVWRWFRDRTPLHRVLLEGLAVVLPAVLIAFPWYARNLTIYGWPDFLGLIRHDQVVLGQTRTVQYIAENGWPAYWRRAVEWTFKSFAGVFGWMGVWLDSRVYYALAVWLAVPVVAWVVSEVQRIERSLDRRIKRTGSGQRASVSLPGGTSQAVYAPAPLVATQAMPVHKRSTAATPSANAFSSVSANPSAESFSSVYPFSSVASLLAVSALLTLLTYIYYNITFLQHQGRYLFTALIPIALFLAAGWRWVLALPGTARIEAGALLLWAATLAVWGLRTTPSGSTGVLKWPFAITVATAVVLAGASLLPERWRLRVYALPFVMLPLAAVYALFGAIVPQLTR